MTFTSALKAFPALASALALAIALPAHAEPKLVPGQSDIGFTVKQMGVPVQGHFKRFDAQVAFDPKALQAAKIALTLDAASAGLGVPEADAELPKPAWFDSAKFPRATFLSTGVKAAGAHRYDVLGKLTIKGHTHDVTVPVTLTQAAGVTTAAGAVAIKRLDYGIGEGEWADTSMVADEVTVHFKLALTGIGPL